MTVEYARARTKELEEICSNRPTTYALADLASCYFTLGYPEKALPVAKQVWEWDRKDSGLGMNLAMIYKDLGMHKESFEVLEIAYYLNPDDFYIRLGYGEALLRAGFWKQAWPIYDNARPTQQAAAHDLGLPRKVREWDGYALPEDGSLIVINEGGHGDRLSYARWLPVLTELGVNWKFYPYDDMIPFFEGIFPPERIIKDGDDITATHWTTTFALPAKLNIGPTEIPPPLPFKATQASIEKYAMARTDEMPIIGLCYAAAELYQGGRKVRSMSEGEAMRLVCMTGDKVHWVSLQHGSRVPYPVTNVPFMNWTDTGGLIHNLDAVVSVDTGCMHLAGGMGKQMAVPLSSNSCWKFTGNKKTHPLYPSATFYRNEGHGRGLDYSIDCLVSDIRSGVWPKKS